MTRQPEELSAREHALRVAVLDVIGDEVTAAYKDARKAAERVFSAARQDGHPQQEVTLPDGTKIGLISIKAGGKNIAIAGEALETWVDGHVPDGMERYADPAALTDPEVLDVLAAVFPHLVKKRIRAATRTALLKEIEDSGGWLVDKETGDKEKIGEVTDLKPTGAFSYRPSKEARGLVIAAWQRGELQEIALDVLALPGAGDGDA